MTSSATGSSAAPEDHPRLTPTQRLHEVTRELHDVAMAALSRKPSAPESSVTLARNAKGHVQIEVVVRNEDQRVAQQQATLLFEELCIAYPYPAVNGGES